MSREIDLIGGFYRDEPWSAQDTVNWLPVKDESGQARSGARLRAAPGVRLIEGGRVLPQFSDLTLVNDRAAYRNFPPDFVTTGTPLMPSAPAPGDNVGTVSRRGIIAWAESATFGRQIQCLRYNPDAPNTPWQALPPPVTDTVTWVSLAWAPNAALLQASVFGAPWPVRVFRLSGSSWSELLNNGPALTQEFRGVVWSGDSTRFVGIQADSASRYQVYDVTGNTFSRSCTDNQNAEFHDRQGQACFPMGGNSHVIALDQSGSFGPTVVELTQPNVTRTQRLPLPLGATGGPRLCKPLSPDAILCGWFFGTTRLHVYTWTNGVLGYGAPAPWQPPSDGNFELSGDGRFLAFLPFSGSTNDTVVVSTETWQPVAIAQSDVTGAVSWMKWAN